MRRKGGVLKWGDPGRQRTKEGVEKDQELRSKRRNKSNLREKSEGVCVEVG